jgi:Tol biopolymer transport system component
MFKTFIFNILLITTGTFTSILCGFSDSPEIIKPFKPDIFKDFPNVRDITISPSGNTIFFSIQTIDKTFTSIAFIEKQSNEWTQPSIASFSGKYRDIEPFYDPRGKRIYFASDRPLEGEKLASDYNIWYVNALEGGKWSDPIALKAPVNGDGNEFYPSVTLSGNLYITAELENTNGKEDIYLCRYQNGQYSAPEPLSDAVNSDNYEFNAYVSPDEQMIVFTSYAREDDLGGGDLYMSKKDAQGDWEKAQNMGEIVNSDKIDYCPYVDTKNNILYFTSQRSAIKKHYQRKIDVSTYHKLNKATRNGMGHIYYVSLSHISISE